ncbi:Copper-exporting P-type ATPase A [bacterium HR11]|nr:Copper-exporting P-type ATPase A [bacterium HR11]
MHPNETRARRWASWAVGGAVLSALAASACCWLPLLALAVGASSAGLAQKLAVYRPYFLTLALAALGAAFYLTYRRPRRTPGGAADGSTFSVGVEGAPDACCAPAPSEASDACCAVPSSAPRWVHRLQHFNRIALWPIAVLVLAVALFPNYVNALLGGASVGKVTSPVQPPAALQEVRFRVGGMDCAMCAVGIRAALERLPGVVRAEVNYPDGSARVVFRDVPSSELQAQIRARIEAMGYRVDWAE